MSLTVPQILMLSHAAKVNHERMQEKIDRDKKAEEKRKELDKKDPVQPNGKRLSECTMDEILPSIGAM